MAGFLKLPPRQEHSLTVGGVLVTFGKELEMSSEGPIIRSLAAFGMTNRRNGRTSDSVLDAVGWMQFAGLVGCRGALLRAGEEQVALAGVAG
jgi:hypothetical protein